MLLDTHAVVFLHAGRMEEFTKEGTHLLETERLRVGPTAVLELQYLYEIGRIRHTALQIIEDLRNDIGLQEYGENWIETVRVAVGCTWTRDPFDRMIAAQAEAGGELLLTRDRKIRRHCAFARW